jgi:signal transduction histidine kinase
MAEQVERTGLAFFGTVTASISHEIKNRMAIINEQAGLLEDLVLMTEQGTPIDMERLKRLARSVKDQVRQGDDIIRNMNRFAHSVDTPVGTFEVKSLLELTAQLAARKASMKGVALKVDGESTEAVLTTAPFPLINLVWLIIEAAAGTSVAGGTICLRWEKGSETVTIRICREGEYSGSGTEAVPEEAVLLASALRADVASDARGGSWTIQLPTGAPDRKGPTQTGG